MKIKNLENKILLEKFCKEYNVDLTLNEDISNFDLYEEECVQNYYYENVPKLDGTKNFIILLKHDIMNIYFFKVLISQNLLHPYIIYNTNLIPNEFIHIDGDKIYEESLETVNDIYDNAASMVDFYVNMHKRFDERQKTVTIYEKTNLNLIDIIKDLKFA